MTLTEWMTLSGLSHKELAEISGVSLQQTYNWAGGKISPMGIACVEAVTEGKVTALDFFPSERARYANHPKAIAARERFVDSTT